MPLEQRTLFDIRVNSSNPCRGKTPFEFPDPSEYIWNMFMGFKCLDGDVVEARKRLSKVVRAGYTFGIETENLREMGDLEVLEIYHDLRRHVSSRGEKLYPRREVD